MLVRSGIGNNTIINLMVTTCITCLIIIDNNTRYSVRNCVVRSRCGDSTLTTSWWPASMAPGLKPMIVTKVKSLIGRWSILVEHLATLY